MNRIPSALSSGDVITLVAPSRFTNQDQIQAVTAILEGEGFRVEVPEGLLEREGQFGGEDAHRARIIQEAWNRKGNGALLPMRGGYGAARLLNHVDLSNASKWMCGFSDITALHSLLSVNGVASLHSPVGSTLINAPDETQSSFFAQLRGEQPALFSATSAIKEGRSEGELVGGNLSVLFSLQGTPFFPDLNGKILFLEDIDEMVYHLDRMLVNFSLSKVFSGLKGVVLGQFSDMRDNTKEFGFSADNPFGKSVYEICSEHFKNLGIPVCLGFASGHDAPNLSLPFGQPMKLEVTEFATTLSFA
ncbi:MAG: LD-carboxypeptidase [Flavobacteriales bacterium]|nr:LD-carboxypeptidase [Flavobacteriales bacterium]MDG1781757.1 LD-carboxypeptidase [Flavobacteriales bacterium]MDG2246429.1 LD-carboxypeptidase [Flavobacteriales bacterium]